MTFLFPKVLAGIGAHLATYVALNSYQEIFPDRPEREPSHSLPSSVMVKNEWGHSSAPPILLHGLYRNIRLLYKCVFVSD